MRGSHLREPILHHRKLSSDRLFSVKPQDKHIPYVNCQCLMSLVIPVCVCVCTCVRQTFNKGCDNLLLTESQMKNRCSYFKISLLLTISSSLSLSSNPCSLSLFISPSLLSLSPSLHLTPSISLSLFPSPTLSLLLPPSLSFSSPPLSLAVGSSLMTCLGHRS